MVRCRRSCFALLCLSSTACSNGWYSKRPSYQLALAVRALSTHISTLHPWCCTRYYTLPRLAGMWPAAVSPRHCHVHGGQRGRDGGACAETPSKTGPALLYTEHRAIVGVWMCCSSCMHARMQAGVCRIALSRMLPVSPVACAVEQHARTRTHARPHAAVALRGNRCSLLLPSTGSDGGVASNHHQRQAVLWCCVE